MTIDEAIKHAEEVAIEQDKLCKRYDDASGYSRSHNEAIRTTDAKRCEECAEEHRQLAEWLKELKDYRERTNWTPISEGYPPIEDEYKHFLVTDDKGEVSVQKFYMSLAKEPQPYFSGMVNVVAWMPRPKPYKTELEMLKDKAESEDKE